MKVCIVRNAELESNANMQRVINAMHYAQNEALTISRNRAMGKNEKKRFIKSNKKLYGKIVNDLEIQLFSERGGGIKNIFSLLKYQYYLFTCLRKNHQKYDVIHSFDLDTGFVSYLISKIYKKKFVYHIADFFADSRPGIPSKLYNVVRYLELYVVNHSDLTIVCTEKRLEQIFGSNPKKVITVHNSPVIQDNEFNNIYPTRLDNEYLKIGYVGGLSNARFILELLEIASNNSNVQVDIAGYGNVQESVIKYADKYPNINYFGTLNYSKSLELYSKVDLIFAMYDPSVKNNQLSAPNKFYESLLLGKPIVVSNGTGVDELVNKENVGYTIDYTTEALSELIEYLFNNKKDLIIKGTHAKQNYKNYSWEEMRERLIAAYQEL